MKIQTVGTSGPLRDDSHQQSSAQSDTGDPSGIMAYDGEMVAIDDVDGLCSMYERLEPLSKSLYTTLCSIRRALSDLSEGDSATRRVRGKEYIAKIELPSVKFEQSVLKALWESHSDLAHEFMRIESIGVKMREYAKLEKTASTDPQFVYFRDTLTNANRGRDGLPAVKIERVK